VTVIVGLAIVLLALAVLPLTGSGDAGEPSRLPPRTAGAAPSYPLSRFPAAAVLRMPPADPHAGVSRACREANNAELTPAGVRAENSWPGNDQWRKATQLSSGPIAIYLGKVTAQCGDTVGVHLRGVGRASGVVSVYRLGWYRGLGGRVLWTSRHVTAPFERIGRPTGPTRAIAMSWPEATRFTIAPSWDPGLYAVVVFPVNGRRPSLAPLVVRADRSSAPVLLMASDTTWAAYNDYGGYSEYLGAPGSTHGQHYAMRSYEVGYARPMAGTGMQQFAAMDVPVAAFLESQGIPVDYTTATAVDTDPSVLLDHPEIVVPGHSEYWTSRMYDGFMVARDRGINLAFLGANNDFWQVRIERDAAHAPVSQVVYKDAALDPMARTAPLQATVQWGAPPLNRDSVQLTGAHFTGVSVFGPERLMSPTSWIVANAHLRPGEIIPAIAGNEVDTVLPTTSPHWRQEPSTVQTIFEGVFSGWPAGGYRSMTVSYYSAKSGAGVFNAGSTYWACTLMDACPLVAAPARTMDVVRAVTLTVVTAFEHPRAGAAHPSAPQPPTPEAAMATLMGASNVGVRQAPGGPPRPEVQGGGPGNSSRSG